MATINPDDSRQRRALWDDRYTHDVSAGSVLIDRVSEVTDELVSLMAHLLPQLSATAIAPDRAALEEVVSSASTSLYLARLDSRPGEIVGTITLVIYRIPSGLHAVIEDVIVDESARGHGVGYALVSHVVDIARDLGARHVNLTSRSARVAANRLYQKAGFYVRDTNVYRLDLS
jgi:ribosomal protein S18 acetylase RimI-like enzyme